MSPTLTAEAIEAAFLQYGTIALHDEWVNLPEKSQAAVLESLSAALAPAVSEGQEREPNCGACGKPIRELFPFCGCDEQMIAAAREEGRREGARETLASIVAALDEHRQEMERRAGRAHPMVREVREREAAALRVAIDIAKDASLSSPPSSPVARLYCDHGPLDDGKRCPTAECDGSDATWVTPRETWSSPPSSPQQAPQCAASPTGQHSLSAEARENLSSECEWCSEETNLSPVTGEPRPQESTDGALTTYVARSQVDMRGGAPVVAAPQIEREQEPGQQTGSAPQSPAPDVREFAERFAEVLDRTAENVTSIWMPAEKRLIKAIASAAREAGR